MKNNKKHLNEMSPELLDRAVSKIDKTLNNPYMVRRLSGWQILRSIRQREQFTEYAELLRKKAAEGNMGTPDDPIPSKKEIQNELKQVHTDQETELSKSNDKIYSPKERLAVISTPKARTAKRNISHEEPIVPEFDNIDDYNPGKYIVRYISSFDNDTCSVWVDAMSISDALSSVLHDYWDIREILDIYIEQDEPSYNNGSDSHDNVVIDPADYDSQEEMNNAIASVYTDGEFDNYQELIADNHDDLTTEEYPDGNIYEGVVESDGSPWKGPKSSYREVLDSEENGEYTSDNDYDIKIVSEIDPNNKDNDTIIKGRFNRDAMRTALNEGVVHFMYKKVKKNPSDPDVERQAFGTTNPAVLAANNVVLNTVQKAEKREYPSRVAYYDLTSHGWRSFRNENIVLIYDESYEG